MNAALYALEGVILWAALLLPPLLAGLLVAVLLYRRHTKPTPTPSWNYAAYVRRVGWPVGLGLGLCALAGWLYVASSWSFFNAIPPGATKTARFGFGMPIVQLWSVFLCLPLSVVDIVRAGKGGRAGTTVGVLGVLFSLSSFFLLTQADDMIMDYYGHRHHVSYRLEE